METKAKHTPGPWTLETVKTSIGCCHKIGKFPSLRENGGYACVYDDGSPVQHPKPELLANARLIAASPDLLAVCKAAKKYLEPELIEPGRSIFWDLVSAIAKAEGL